MKRYEYLTKNSLLRFTIATDENYAYYTGLYNFKQIKSKLRKSKKGTYFMKNGYRYYLNEFKEI